MVYENVNAAIQAIHLMSKVLGPPMFYRGQHHDWSISSSAHRLRKQNNKELWEAEMLKTQNFIDWLKARRKNSSLFESVQPSVGDLPYWAIAQHYGYKTDFIDFTTDINIAKAFALIGKQPDENGIIFCLWENDVDLIRKAYKEYSKQLSTISRGILESVEYNPFFHFNLPEISRITNQKGLFLWDANALASQLFAGLMDQYLPSWTESHIFRFKQTDISVEKALLRRIYPSPSMTELDIDHFVQRYHHDSFYQNNNITILPRLDIDLSDHFLPNPWTLSHMFTIDPKEHYPSDEQESIEVTLPKELILNLTVEKTACIEFVRNWLYELEQNHYILYVSESNDTNILLTEIINEVLSSLSLYKNLGEICLGVILHQSLRLLNAMLFLCKYGLPDWFNKINNELEEYHYNLTDSHNNPEKYLDMLRSRIPLKESATMAWGHEFIFTRLENDTGNNTAVVFPKFYSNEDKFNYRKEHLRVLHELYSQALIPPTVIAYEKRELKRVLIEEKDISWELMLDVVHDPRILLSQEDALFFSIYFFIPWQIVVSPQKNRIYNPFEVVNMRRLELDNFVEKYPIYCLDGGYYIQLDEDTFFTEDVYSIG